MKNTGAVLISSLVIFTAAVPGDRPRGPTDRRVWVGPRPTDFEDRWGLSRDGRRLVFRDSESYLSICEMRTSKIRKLSVRLPSEQWRAGFVWSADGSQIAFNRTKPQGEELAVIALRGERVSVVSTFDGPVTPIGWSGDGRRIAIQVEHGTSVDLNWVTIGSGSIDKITRVADAFRNGRSFSAVLSPDSAEIAFTRIATNGNRDIFTIRGDGAQQTALAAHPADDYPVGYTKVGTLLFASDRSGTVDLWAIPSGPASDRRATQIKRNLGSVIPIAVTHSGAVYYLQLPCTADVQTTFLDSGLNAVSRSGKTVATRFTSYNTAPDWSPSDDEIVLQIGQPGIPDGVDLAFVSMRDGREWLVHPEVLQFSRPRYTAEGKSVVVHGIGMNGVQGIFEIDKQSGKARLLLPSTGEGLANPIPRVNQLFYESGGHSVRVSSNPGAPGVTLYESQARNANFTSAPSPDGKTVAIVDGDALITVRPGAPSPRVLSLKEPEQFHPFPGSLDWSADGRFILFTKVVGRERQVWRIPAVGGHPEPVGISTRDQALYFLRMSPDGKNLAFVTGDCDLRPREVWALEGFLEVPSAR